MDASRNASFNAIIGDLYEAAVEPQIWRSIPTRLASFFEAGSSTLWVWTPGAGETEGLNTFGWTQKDLDAYRTYYAERDIWSTEGVKQPMGSALLMSEVVPARVFSETEFYRDLGRHLGLFYCMGTALPIEDAQLCILGLHRPRDRPDFGIAEQRQLRLLIPHLKRALQLRNRVRSISQEGRLGFAALDALTVAIVIVDEHACVVHANAAAEAIAAERDGIVIFNKHLAASASATTSALRRLIESAAATSAGRAGGAGGSLAAPRPSGRRAFNVVVTPLPAAQLTDGRQRPCAAVFILNPESRIALGGEVLSQLFGLSATEARVLLELGSGLSVEQIAEGHGVSRNTVRSQLQQVFEKTDTRRQAEAVALVSRLGLIAH